MIDHLYRPTFGDLDDLHSTSSRADTLRSEAA